MPELLRLDGDGTVRLGDRPVTLTPTPARLLALLVARAGQVVTTRQAAEVLWPSRSVVCAVPLIANHVIRIRRTLGDDARRPTYVENVPGLGYRLRAEMVAGGG